MINKKQIGLIFPHQLYEENVLFTKCDEIWIIEDDLYFMQYPFHKQKLVLHRASMRYYSERAALHCTVKYFESKTEHTLLQVFEQLTGTETLHVYHTDDYLLERRLQRYAQKFSMELVRYDNPNFIENISSIQRKLGDKKHYLMGNFYVQQRKEYRILLDGDNPVGGQWSFDADNRKKVPKNEIIPENLAAIENDYLTEAKVYVNENFPENYGNTESFFYPITHQEAKEHLTQFLTERFEKFGAYEDAIIAQEYWLWHSVLTPMLNIGLLSPKYIVNEALIQYKKQNLPLNSVEGFIRQIIGWREFIRGIYVQKGVFQRTHNGLGLSRKIPESFWNGSTGIVPIDTTIKKLLKTGYTHHIERLMILGNFFLLCEFDPNEVYRWFMALYIDAYDWVMVPNVYGMIAYADEGLMTTKPYISSSNYVLKMSDYSKGDWCQIWDALYWNFIFRHRARFEKNIRMVMMVRLLDKMPPEKLQQHLQIAEKYLSGLSNSG